MTTNDTIAPRASAGNRPTLDERELARSMAVSQAARFFSDVLDGRSADDVLSEHAAELDLYLATLEATAADSFRTVFEDEYEALQRAVVKSPELRAIIAAGTARNRKTRRQLVMARTVAVALCAIVAVALAYSQLRV